MQAKARRPAFLLAALISVVALAAACDPGWTSASLGTGDGSGTVPGSVDVPAADVSLVQASATVDLGVRGYLTYDAASCRIYRTVGGSTTLFAGNGTCGNSGDGGPATEASIDILLPPFGTGLQVDDQGSVLLDAHDHTAGNGLIRKIDQSGTITRVATPDSDGLMMGINPSGDGGVVYLLYSTNESADTYEIREVDASGNDVLVATWTGHGAAGPPASFVTVGPDHWVVLGWGATTSNGQVLVDIDHGTVTTADLANPPGVGTTDYLFLNAADSAGNLYGVTYVDQGDDGYWGRANRVIRIRPDRTIDVIAGSGAADPETSRQMGTGADLDLSALAVSVTRQSNLLISSGHTVYRMIDAAHAPAIVPAGS
ncbi:MAG TPA: hypothetical protein VFN21_02875 [Acidimicrobiales bacterium]|nr:hypothetical protein [Acidimicrobiales bacterium]